ncbi:MAG TPA: ABC transporter permease [Candidatus Limnocylindria bacterium]|jgi:ABC-type multidrug transport system permease subunit|nr:ABC transporter permease [Candidatus Limnocylindria bacterium]
MTNELRAAWAVARKELLIARRYPLQLVTEVLQPLYQFLLPSLLLGATFYVGGRAIGLEASAGTDDLAGFLFIGIIVAGVVAAAFWDMAFGLKREMDSGTLEPMWLTPTRPDTTVLGRAISGMIVNSVASIILIAAGVIFFGAALGGALLPAVPVLLLATISMVGVGYMVAAGVLMIREPNFMVDATNFVFSTLSGVAFPIVVLPLFLQPIAYALPTTYAVDLIRHYALETRPLLDPGLEWAVLVAFAVGTVAVGRWLFLRTEHRMRVRGTTGQH